MSTDLARFDPNPEQLDLLKRTVAKDATNDEFALFIAVATRAGLDPFANQIYCVKRAGKMSIQTGIGGLWLIAHRTGELTSSDGPEWCGKDGQWRDVWLEDEPPHAAKVIVARKGIAFTAIVLFSEFAERTAGRLTYMWEGKPSHMLGKCAEAGALRKAFPAEMMSLYIAEEMGQTDNPAPELGADRVREASRLAVERMTMQALPAVVEVPDNEPAERIIIPPLPPRTFIRNPPEPDETDYEAADLPVFNSRGTVGAPAEWAVPTTGMTEPTPEQLAEWTPNDWIALAKLAGRKLADPAVRSAGVKSWRDPTDMTPSQRSHLWWAITQPTETVEQVAR